MPQEIVGATRKAPNANVVKRWLTMRFEAAHSVKAGSARTPNGAARQRPSRRWQIGR